MKKYIRKHLKDEKRILKLLYIKGLFSKIGDIKSVGWESFKSGKKGRRGVNRSKYVFRDYLPELHFFSVDYWGEGSEYAVVEAYKSLLYWENGIHNEETGDFVPDFKRITNIQLIEHLKSLPTVKKDSKFNRFLKVRFDN